MQKFLLLISCWCIGSLLSFTAFGVGLKGNVAETILTPPLEMGYSLGGYGARMSKPAEGIHDDIWAKALVLTDGNIKYAIVTMDILLAIILIKEFWVFLDLITFMNHESRVSSIIYYQVWPKSIIKIKCTLCTPPVIL